jgi:hypothetical protein
LRNKKSISKNILALLHCPLFMAGTMSAIIKSALAKLTITTGIFAIV